MFDRHADGDIRDDGRGGMKLIVAFGEAVLTASVIVSGVYAAYAVAFDMLDAYRYRQEQRTTSIG
jgi:hypothetical protein